MERLAAVIEGGGYPSYISTSPRGANFMSAVESVLAPVLAGSAPPPKKAPSFLRQILAPAANQFEALPQIVYEIPVWESKNLFGHSFLISDPAGVKRVLLDNVANYPKTEMERKLLGATVGEGLLVSEGEKWKSHRRLMSPSFDFKSIVSYSPAMVAAADTFANAWAAKAAS